MVRWMDGWIDFICFKLRTESVKMGGRDSKEMCMNVIDHGTVESKKIERGNQKQLERRSWSLCNFIALKALELCGV